MDSEGFYDVYQHNVCIEKQHKSVTTNNQIVDAELVIRF